MADLKQRKKELEQNKKEFANKTKKGAWKDIEYQIEQINKRFKDMKRNSFELPSNDMGPAHQFYKNNNTDEIQIHLDKIKKTFHDTLEKELILVREESNIEDEEKDIKDGFGTSESSKELKKRAQKIASDIMKEIGQVSSDSGLCWIGDPAYVMHTKELPKNLGKDWQGFVDKLGPTISNFAFDNKKKGLGITVTTGGDGSFPVYAKTGDGKVKSIMIIFDDEIPQK